jgi:AcrR family transcriptional regulator
VSHLTDSVTVYLPIMTSTSTARRRSEGRTPEEQTEKVLGAAEACIERHGIRKTTMDDIAKEAGMSRPSIYRFFADRDELLFALTKKHSRALVQKTHRFIARQSTFSDGVVEGLMYLADHGRRDPFTRLLVSPQDDSGFGRRFGLTVDAAELAGEFWYRLFDAAEASGDMRKGLDRGRLNMWFAGIGLMLMTMLDTGSDPAELRRMVRELVVPALQAS